MSRKRVIFSALTLIFAFISIHAGEPACIDYVKKIERVLSKIESMEGVYTKEVVNANEKIKTKISFFEDNLNKKKRLSVSDSKGTKTDIYLLNDTMFVLDKPAKTIYFVDMNEYGDVGRKLFDINVFETFSMLGQFDESDSIVSVTDKNGKFNVSFLSDTSNPVYSMVIVRFNNDSLPEIIEMYDWQRKVIMQIEYSKYKNNLPTAIKSLSKVGDIILEEKVTISKLKTNTKIEDKNFSFSRKGYTLSSLKDALELIR